MISRNPWQADDKYIEIKMKGAEACYGKQAIPWILLSARRNSVKRVAHGRRKIFENAPLISKPWRLYESF
jgi:hypothetical protein